MIPICRSDQRRLENRSNSNIRKETLQLFSRMFKKFVFYALRWQMSTPILAPVLIYSDHFLNFGTNGNFWVATFLANFIGACIFFWVDKFIFGTKIRTLWEVKEETACSACGKVCRCYRLFKAKHYDRTDDKKPIFLCEVCSKQKVEQLKQRGVVIP